MCQFNTSPSKATVDNLELSIVSYPASDLDGSAEEVVSVIPLGVPVASSTHGGYGIGLDELVKIDTVQALNRHDGVGELSILLNTDLEKGIDTSDVEIQRRRETFGSNTYLCQKGISFWGCVWKASQSLPLPLMILAAVIQLLLRINTKDILKRLYVESCILLVVVLAIIVRATTERWQFRQFEKFSEEKRNVHLEVIRGGRRVSVSTNDIVVGDIVPLKNGVQVPADGVLFVANSLKIDEREITASHENHVQKDLINDPLLFSGSKVIEGIGKMLVTRVGINTGWGEIRHETDEEKPFQVYLERLTSSASCLVILLASIAYVVQLCQYFSGRTKKTDGTPLFILGTTTAHEATKFVIKCLSFGIATVVLALPVGFSTAVRLNLAQTTRKMMSDNALVQKLSACETMGTVTTILCHKTGLLTSNQMSVVDVWAGGIRTQDVDSLPQLPTFLKELIMEGIAHNTHGSVVFETGVTEVYGSPTEKAILGFGNKLGMKFDDVRSSSLVHHTIPFNPNKKYGGVALQLDTEARVHWKGSAKVILSFCVSYMDETNELKAIDEQQRKVFEEMIERMCMQGLRCAALAYRPYKMECPPPIADLVLLTIIGIEDPCRAGTREAIQLCRSGGVKVCMVTDDVILTAKAKAIECGILWDAQAVTTGDQFRVLSDERRDAIAGNISVYAQASPSDIVLLVEALKRTEEIVAATGMGIHDSAILHAGNVGLAMGIGGTAAAKENSDIIILDDSFVTILKVIKWCRSLYTNIQKYVQFRLTVSGSALSICVVEVVFYNAFPLNAVQLLLLNLIVDIFGALALAYKPTTNVLMGKPPVGKRDPLITKTMWFKLVIQVLYLVMFLAVIHSDSILKLKHGTTKDAELVKNTFIYNSLVFCLVFGEFEIRSTDQTFKQILRDNMFLATITGTIIFQIFAIQFFGIFIHAVSLDWKKWMLCAAVGFFSQFATRFPLEAHQYYRN